MRLVLKIVFWGLLLVAVPTYSMEQRAHLQQLASGTQQLEKNSNENPALYSSRQADRCVPILDQDQDGRILWGNIAAVAAFALVLGYAFYQ